MIIRQARSTEVRTLAALGVIAWEQAFAAAGEVTNHLREKAEATYYGFCEQYWPIIIAAEIDGETVGWAALEPGQNKITDVWVLPNFQRHGIGTALLSELEQQAVSREFDEVFLETHAKNSPALSFFKKHEYTISGLKSAYSPTMDKSVDTLEMRKRFN